MKIANGMEFENDEAVIGKWKNIGWSESKTIRTLEGLNEKSGEYTDLYFLPDGEPYWVFEGWTKGFLLIYQGGDAPVLTYHYDLNSIDGKQYLFFRLDSKTEVFEKVDGVRYTKETLGNHDNIDLPFIPDEQLIGKWVSVAYVDSIESFTPSEDNTCLFLKSIEVFADGTLTQLYMDDDRWQDRWTKGFIMSTHRKTAMAYVIKDFGGVKYLFMEWKMGNYIYGGLKPDYYVFKRFEQS